MFKSENLIKIIKFGVYLALLAPLIYIPQTIFAAVFGKMIYFQIIIELTLPFFLYLIIFYRNYRPKFNLLTKIILLFFAVIFITSVLGIDFNKSFWGYNERMRGLFSLLHYLALYFYIISSFKDYKEKKALLFFVILVGFIVACFGVLERINPAWSIDKSSIKAASGHRIMSTIGNPIFLAGYMIFICFLSLYYYLVNKGYSRYFALGNFALSIIAILFTGTRGAFLGLIFGIGLFLIYIFFLAAKKQKIAIAVFFGFFIVILALFAVFNNYIVRKNGGWSLGRIVPFSFNLEDGSTSGRLLLWSVAWQSFKQRPLLGWGLENFDYAFDKNYDARFLRNGITETWADRTHNWFLDWLTMAGITGLALYLLIYFAIFYRLMKKEFRTKKANAAFFAVFAAIFIFGFFEVDDPATSLMFFFSLAFLNLIFNEEINDEELTNTNQKFACPPSIRVPQSRSGAEVFRRYERWVFLCFLVPMFLFVYVFNIKPLYAGIDFLSFKHADDLTVKKALAEKFLSADAPYRDNLRLYFGNEIFYQVDKIKDAQYVKWGLAKAAEEVESASKNHPKDFSHYHLLGNLYLRQGNLFNDAESYRKALEYYGKAEKMSERRQAVAFQMATTHLLLHETAEAVKILEKTVSYDEMAALAKWRLAVAYLADKQRRAAYETFKDAVNNGFFGSIFLEMKQASALCVEFKDYQCAVKELEAVNQQFSGIALNFAELAAAYAAVGKFAEAAEAVYEAVRLDPSLEAEAQIFLKQIGY